ncbi:hypothetical protein ACFL1T_02190 [Chlamydiota bacterium]
MRKCIALVLISILVTGTLLAQPVIVERRDYYHDPYYYHRVYGRRGHPRHYYYRNPRYYNHPYNAYYHYGPEYVSSSTEVYSSGPIVSEEMIVE